MKASLSCSISSSKRLQGAGRPLKDKDFDKKLINWVCQQRQKKLRVSRTMIQKEALTLSINKNFKASNGCLEKFCSVTAWSHAAQRRLVRRSRRSTLRTLLITFCLSSKGVASPTTHTYLLPTRRPCTWITRAV